MEACEEDERFEERKCLHMDLEALMLLTTLQSGQTWFSWIQKIGPPLFVHIRVCASQRVLGLFLIFGFDLIFYSLGNVSKGIAHFVTSGARVRGEEPSTESHEM